ncbi:MAG: hypothetical protein P4L27_12530 [Ignavibacteriaceae bacterium]|nr:hypothetical protein [Ignavibacteriaceae bacterium]
MSSRKYSKLFFVSFSLLIFLFLVHSCKDSSTIVGSGTSKGTVTMSVTSPKNGDTLKVASVFTIQWSSNSTSTVKIEYSIDNGATWTLIADSLVNNGSYIWPVPNHITYTGKVRITTDDNLANGISTGNFNIFTTTGKALTLAKPNGGEVLYVNESFRIEWVSSGVTSVKIEYSINNGIAWNPLVLTYPADSSYYLWSPIPSTPSAQCLVRITDVSNDSITDKSKSVFSIASPQTIKVLSPNGGESWNANSTQPITWYSSQVNNVKIEYTIDNGNSWSTITSSTPSVGYFLWSALPNTPSTNARIRISEAVSGFPSDASDSVFTISPQPALKIISPDGGENWMSGSSQTIRWNALGKINFTGNSIQKLKSSPYFPLTIANIKIDFTTNNGSEWISIVPSTPNNGTYLWNSVPSLNSSLCRVKISDADAGVPFVVSDSTFVIYNNIPRDIVVKSPNGGEIWQAGTTQVINWSSTGVTSVKIDFTTNNGVDWNTIVDSIPSTGYYSWKQIPNTPSTNCRIRITDAANGFPSNQSTTTFTIAPPPEITVLSPNGGETLQAGSNTNISWTSTNVANVKIEFTTDNGADWSPIIASTPSIGHYVWPTIPSVNSSLCRIKISNADGTGQPYDISHNNFTITNLIVQSIKLNSPVGGESWESGTTHNITWNGTAINAVKIEFTSNNGIDWTTIVANVLGSGSYAWNLPDINSTQCKIRISDATDGTPSDVSGSVFSITPVSTISVIAPAAGDVFVAGDPIDLKWSSTGIEKVKIEYTTNNGITNLDWHTLVDSTPSNGLYTTSFSVASDQYRIRISEARSGSPIAYSNGVFTISPQPVRTITVTSPNGGENWLVNTTDEIRWTSTNVDSVKIEYTIDGGANWNTIANKVPSNGLYNWTVPLTQYRSDLCQIKVSNARLGTPSDISDGYFSIQPNTKLLRWIFPNGGEYISQDTLITWVSTGVSNVNIEYTDDNGNTWNPVVNNYHSTGAYFWFLPSSQPSTLSRLRITDSGDPSITDMSDSYFNLHILKGLNIKSTGNTNLTAGSNMNITWNASNKISSVRIEYSDNNGSTWHLIANNVPSTYKKDNGFLWKNIPKVKGNILIRLTDTNGKYSTKSRNIKIN